MIRKLIYVFGIALLSTVGMQAQSRDGGRVSPTNSVHHSNTAVSITLEPKMQSLSPIKSYEVAALGWPAVADAQEGNGQDWTDRDRNCQADPDGWRNGDRDNDRDTNDVGSAAGPTGFLLPRGYFHTRGAQIVDCKGNPVRIAAVGWPGYDGNGYVFRGLYSVGYKATMRGMVADGFNTVRYTLNPDLVGLTGIQIMDKAVEYAGKIGLRIIFDHHTNDGGSNGNGGQQPNGLWFDKGPGTDNTDGGGDPGTITAAQFEKDTITLAIRYRNSPAVIGYDLDNEPLGVGANNATTLNWGLGGPTDIWQMYTTVGNALLKVNPHLLIICEGPQTYNWNPPNGMADIGPEGDLSAVGGFNGNPAKPVVLKLPHQVVYSVHEYATDIDDYGDNEQPSTLIPHMNADWGYLVTQHIAPVWIGEMGTTLATPQEQLWAQTMVDYMNGKDGAQGGPVFTGNQQGIGGDWWLWGNFDGEEPDGTLEDDWKTPRPDQKAITDQMSYFPAHPDR
jgi:endoglucanase